MPDQGERTHEATPHRRQRAREQGQVAKSHDLASAALLVGAILVLMYLGGNVSQMLAEVATRHLGGEAWLTADPDFAFLQWRIATHRLGWALVPIFGLFVVIAVVVNVGQVGILFLPQKLALDLSRINPAKGAQRLLSLANGVRLGFGVFKITVVAIVGLWSVLAERTTLMELVGMDVPQIASFVVQITTWTALKIGIALLILAILDYAFQRWKHERDLRMSTQELREEFRNTTGDPMILQRRKLIQRELAKSRLGNAVPKADVVIANPTHFAVAIQYDFEKMAAPAVVAKGADEIAQRIRRIALENGVPIVERKQLARFLYHHVKVGQPIPSEKYAAVAEILRYVYELKGRPLPGMDAA